MADFSKELKLTLSTKQPVEALKLIEAELKKVNDLIAVNADRSLFGDLSRAQVELQELKNTYEELVKQQQISTQNVTANTTAVDTNTDSIVKNTSAIIDNTDEIREGAVQIDYLNESMSKSAFTAEQLTNITRQEAEARYSNNQSIDLGINSIEDLTNKQQEYLKLEKLISKANESSAKAFIGVSKAAFTAVGTFEQFLVPLEEQGQLLAKLFQAFGLIQTATETYNAVKDVEIALSEAQALSNLKLASSAEVVAAATAEASISTRILSAALSTLGGPLTFLLTGIAAASAAFLIFRKSTVELIQEQDRLVKSFIEVKEAELNLRRETAAIATTLIKDQTERTRKGFEDEKKFTEESIRLKLLEVKSKQDAIEKLGPATTGAIKKQIDEETKLKDQAQADANALAVKFNETNRKQREFEIDLVVQTENEKLEAQKNALETRTDLESKYQQQLIDFNQKEKEIRARIQKGESEAQLELNTLQQERNNASIEFSRDKRLRLLEEFKLERDLQIKALEGRTDIESELLKIELERQKAQKELNTLILNEEIPAGERINRQKELELSYNKQLLAVQVKINQQILDNEEAIKDLSIEELLTDLEKPGETLEGDLTNRLKSIELKTENAVENLKQKYNELLVAATGDEALTKSLEARRDLEIGILNNKAARETELATKTTNILIEQAKLKDIALKELQSQELKRQLELDVTTFESRKELNSKLLELQIERFEKERDIQLLQTTNEDEKKRINETFDFLIKRAKETNATINEISEESVIEKLFGSPAEVKTFIESSKKVSDSITGIANAIDNLDGFANDASGSFKAIVSSFSVLTSGASEVVSKISGLEDKLKKDLVGASDEAAAALKEQFSKDKTAAIVAAAGQALNQISGLVVNTIVEQLDRQIEDIDKKLDDLKTKKDDIDDEIKQSQQNALDLEKQLADAKAQDRERIINLIEQERKREKQLADDKKKFAAQERQLIEEKKQLQRKAFIAKKAQALIEVAINTAVGISAALINPVTAPVIVPIIAALGAVQAGVIAAQPIPEFRKGGFTPRDKDDSKPVGVVHANEYVIPAPIVRNPRYRPLIENIEKDRLKGYQSGGLVTPNESPSDQLQRTLEVAIALSQRPIVASIQSINDENARQIQIQQFVQL